MKNPYPTQEGLLEQVYDFLENNRSLEGLYVPHSDVFFVRTALEVRFGVDISLEQAEEYMRLAGWTDNNGNN